MSSTGWKEKDDRTIREICAYLESRRLDAFIPWKATHLAYLTNFSDFLHRSVSWEERCSFLVVLRDGTGYTVGVGENLGGQPSFDVGPWWITERFGADRPGLNVAQQLVASLESSGLKYGRLGVETKWIPSALMDYLRDAMPSVEFIPANSVIPQIRLIKTVRELSLLSAAASIGLQSMESYMTAIRAGATSAEAAVARAQTAISQGGEWVGGADEHCWNGGTDSTPDWWDGPAKELFYKNQKRSWDGLAINPKCIVTHFECLYQCYYSDIAWHEFVDLCPSGLMEFREHPEITYKELLADFEFLRRIQFEAISCIRPGMLHTEAKVAIDRWLDSNSMARRHITEYYIHGIGLEVHEEPFMHTSMRNPTPLDGEIRFDVGAVVSSEWFTKYWTVEEPFVLSEDGWSPLIELREVTA